MGFRLRFTRRFSMAHRLTSGCSVLCATPHGHNEFVSVELAPPSRQLDGHTNMVVEFATAKRRWHRFVDEHLDHALQLSDSDPLIELAGTHFPDWRLVVTPGDPTTELMAALLASKCQAIVEAEGLELRVVRVDLVETPTNTVIINDDFRSLLPAQEGWWSRADTSTR